MHESLHYAALCCLRIICLLCCARLDGTALLELLLLPRLLVILPVVSIVVPFLGYLIGSLIYNWLNQKRNYNGDYRYYLPLTLLLPLPLPLPLQLPLPLPLPPPPPLPQPPPPPPSLLLLCLLLRSERRQISGRIASDCSSSCGSGLGISWFFGFADCCIGGFGSSV